MIPIVGRVGMIVEIHHGAGLLESNVPPRLTVLDCPELRAAWLRCIAKPPKHQRGAGDAVKVSMKVEGEVSHREATSVCHSVRSLYSRRSAPRNHHPVRARPRQMAFGDLQIAGVVGRRALDFDPPVVPMETIRRPVDVALL